MTPHVPNRVVGLTFERWGQISEFLRPEDRLAALPLHAPEQLEECWANLAWQTAERTEWELQGRPIHLDEDAPREGRALHHGTATSTSTRAGRVRLSHDDPLRNIPAAVYLPALTGELVSSSGRTRCPMPDHDDLNPSAKAYGTNWCCFSCGARGTVIDLGAALYGLEPTGSGYWQIRDRLVADLEGVLDV